MPLPCQPLLTELSAQLENIKVRERRIVRSLWIFGIPVGNKLALPPLRRVFLDPFGKEAMADVRYAARFFLVTRIDDDEPPSVLEERPHIRLKNLVLHQMVNNVERESQIEASQIGRDLGGEIKMLVGIAGKPFSADVDRSLGHIEPYITWGCCHRPLGAISAAELDHRSHFILRDKIRYHFRFECFQPAIG